MKRSSTLAADEVAPLGRALDLVGRAATGACRWRRRRRTRASLDQLNDRMLADIGLNRADVMTMRVARRRG
jgi:uncharacterized protein YjiS (DUF1127 family)